MKKAGSILLDATGYRAQRQPSGTGSDPSHYLACSLPPQYQTSHDPQSAVRMKESPDFLNDCMKNFWKRKGELSSTLHYGQTFHRKEESRGHCRWDTWAKAKSGASWHFLKMWKITSFSCRGSWKSVGLRLMLKVRQHREGGTCQDEEVCGRWGVTPCRPCVNPSPLPRRSRSQQSAECALRPGLLPLRQHHQVLTSASAMQRRGRLRKPRGRGQLRWASSGVTAGGRKGRGQVLAGPGGRTGVRSQQDPRAGGPVSSCWDSWNRNGKREMKLKSKIHVT